jgi:hypothetical protein
VKRCLAKFGNHFRLQFLFVGNVHILAPIYVHKSRSVIIQAYFMKRFLKPLMSAKNALCLAGVHLVA